MNKQGGTDPNQNIFKTDLAKQQFPETDAWYAPGSPGPLPMPLQPLLVDYALHRIRRAATAGSPGAVQLVNYFAMLVLAVLPTRAPDTWRTSDLTPMFRVTMQSALLAAR